MIGTILLVLAALVVLALLITARADSLSYLLKRVAAPIAIAALLGVYLIVAGCTLLGQPIADKVADAIDSYCNEPLTARQVYRDAINDELADDGHRIEVTCAGDPGG